MKFPFLICGNNIKNNTHYREQNKKRQEEKEMEGFSSFKVLWMENTLEKL